MIDIDYLLKTQKGTIVQTNKPLDEIKHVDGNVMLVQGPSSMGKSTVMNMIALGAFGESDLSLSESVRTDLRELSSAAYRDLSFDIQLSDSITGKRLSMSKKSGKKDIKVIEEHNGSQNYLSAETFRKKYNLIYDVPEDPTKRLAQIRDALKDDHRDVENGVKAFLEVLKNKREAIDHVPTPESIEQKRKEYNFDVPYLQTISEKAQELKNKRISCDCLILCKSYDNYTSEIELVSKQLEFEKKKKIIPSSGEDRRSEAVRNYKQIVSKITIKANTRAKIVESRNQSIIKKLREIDNIPIESNHLKLLEYTQKINEMKKIVPDVIANKEAENHIRLINELLRALNRSDQNMSLGEIGSVRDLIDSLETLKRSESMNDCFDYEPIRKELSDILANIPRVSSAADAIEKADNTPAQKGQDPAKIKDYTDKLRNLEKSCDEVIKQLREKGINISQIAAEQLKICKELDIIVTSKIDELKEIREEVDFQYRQKLRDVEEVDKRVKRNKEAIEQYENTDKPKYYDQRKKIISIIDACSKIRTSVKAADSRLEKVILHDDSDYRRNEKAYQNMWDYIGYKLGTVRDCGITYEVSSVNLLAEGKGDIVTKDGVIIHIGAMGTGEGQLSYLQGLLSSDDDRMIIALFDEVGNMSNNLLESLTDELTALHRQGKLMLAFMARPTSDVFEVKVYD